MAGEFKMIPDKLRSFNFVLLRSIGEKYKNKYGASCIATGKETKEPAWQTKIHRIDDSKLQEHLARGGNIGVQSNGSSILIEGKTYFLIVIDFDKKEFQDKVLPLLPETFTTTSGSPKQCYHLWFASDNNKAFKIHDENMDTLCDMIGAGNQVVAPPSKHSSGSSYSVVKDLPIKFIPYAELEALLKPHDKKPKKERPIKEYSLPKTFNQDIAGKSIDSISMKQVLEEIGIDTSKNPTNCFGHSSKGGKCFSWNEEVTHCFHCDNGWNKFSLIREAKNLTDKETFEWFAEKAGLTKELKKERKEFVKEQQLQGVDIFTIRGRIAAFWEQHPFMYDKRQMFWIWDKENYCWVQSDETDLANAIQKQLGLDTIKDKWQIVEGFRQVGREKIPLPIKKSWVQFKSKIYDIETNEQFIASPKYFVTSPIPYELSDKEDCPNITKLFDEWVGAEFTQTLYEIAAYCITPDKFMQRLIALVGAGSNGKGTFASLIKRLIGNSNYTSSELKELCSNRFETSALYRKLLCIIGEVSYDDIQNTNQLKKISGEDELRYEFKGKTPFSDINTATIMCLTNALPQTPDKSLGFYRRWLIIDFPNQFPVGKNPIDSITDEEMSCFARKCFNALVGMYKTRKFTNEGTYEQREQLYEEKSNPIVKFIEQNCEDWGGKHIVFKEFTDRLNIWLREHRQRPLSPHQIGKMLRNNGYDVSSRKIPDEKQELISTKVILNLQFKEITTKTTITDKNQTENIRVESNSKNVSNSGNSGKEASDEPKD